MVGTYDSGNECCKTLIAKGSEQDNNSTFNLSTFLQPSQ
jgi:hypothetical protein